MTITDIEYSIDGGPAQSSGKTDFPITIPVSGTQTRSVRVRNRSDDIVSPWSNAMTGTPIAPEPSDRIWGQWEFEVDGNYPDLADYSSTSEWTFNVGKSASRGTSGRAGTVSRGLKYVPHVDANVNRDGEGSAWNRIVRYKQDYGGGRDDSEVAFIHIIDEPHRKGALYSFLESAMAEGRKSSRNGPNLKYGYTINASHLRALPNPTINVEGTQTPNPLGTPTVDYILFQYYPFRNPNHPDWSQSETATNKSDFLSLGATRISQLRGYFPNSEVIIVAQSFYGEHDKFLKPPDEAPLWYAELAEQEDIAGTIWWTRLTKGSGDARTYGSDRSEFATFRNNMELAYNQYIK